MMALCPVCQKKRLPLPGGGRLRGLLAGGAGRGEALRGGKRGAAPAKSSAFPKSHLATQKEFPVGFASIIVGFRKTAKGFAGFRPNPGKRPR
jgi:hypothetical protein